MNPPIPSPVFSPEPPHDTLSEALRANEYQPYDRVLKAVSRVLDEQERKRVERENRDALALEALNVNLSETRKAIRELARAFDSYSGKSTEEPHTSIAGNQVTSLLHEIKGHVLLVKTREGELRKEFESMNGDFCDSFAQLREAVEKNTEELALLKKTVYAKKDERVYGGKDLPSFYPKIFQGQKWKSIDAKTPGAGLYMVKGIITDSSCWWECKVILEPCSGKIEDFTITWEELYKKYFYHQYQHFCTHPSCSPGF